MCEFDSYIPLNIFLENLHSKMTSEVITKTLAKKNESKYININLGGSGNWTQIFSLRANLFIRFNYNSDDLLISYGTYQDKDFDISMFNEGKNIDVFNILPLEDRRFLTRSKKL